MLTALGNFFASITFGIAALFGAHEAPVPVPPAPKAVIETPTPKHPSIQKVVTPTPRVKTEANTTSHTQTPAPVIQPAVMVAPPPIATPPVQIAKPTPSMPTVKVTTPQSSVPYGETTTVSWTATDALSCTLDPSPVLLATTGSQTVSPTDPKADWSKSNVVSYTVKCTGNDGSVSGSATVTVQPWVPPKGVKVLPVGECTFTTQPCTTGPGGLSCIDDGCGG